MPLSLTLCQCMRFQPLYGLQVVLTCLLNNKMALQVSGNYW